MKKKTVWFKFDGGLHKECWLTHKGHLLKGSHFKFGLFCQNSDIYVYRQSEKLLTVDRKEQTPIT